MTFARGEKVLLCHICVQPKINWNRYLCQKITTNVGKKIKLKFMESIKICLSPTLPFFLVPLAKVRAQLFNRFQGTDAFFFSSETKI
jgi:hypothetical protein